MKDSNLWQWLLRIASKIGVTPGDDEDTILQKQILIITTLLIIVAGILWGAIYLFFNEPIAGAIPLMYSSLSAINIIILSLSRRYYKTFRFNQLLFILLLPFFLMLVLGGFINSSAVVLWSLMAPLGALMCCKSPQAIYWFLAYLGLLIIGGISQPYLRAENNLPEEFIRFFFVINVGAVSAIAFLVLNYFVRQKDLALELMRKHRELEKAYLQQEITLRQSEKLATLGKLSAGIAHELNNPAAAAQRNVNQLEETINKLEEIEFKLGQLNLSNVQLQILNSHTQLIRQRSKQPESLNPLTRSQREDEMETWLKTNGVNNAWEFAPTLVDLGYNTQELTSLAENFSEETFPIITAYLCNLYSTNNLLEETGKGISRITQIINALKSYSYLDQAPIQLVDVHEGLNNTIVILQNKLNNGINVTCEYDKDLPRIEAYGSELNQVWTNIIDNAIDALNGNGEIVIKTYKDDAWIVVEINDNGPGIPDELQSKVFDPFVTTKPPGEGTGLGLNICHNIVVQKHRGQIYVDSKPGATSFTIKLPLNLKNVSNSNNNV